MVWYDTIHAGHPVHNTFLQVFFIRYIVISLGVIRRKGLLRGKSQTGFVLGRKILGFGEAGEAGEGLAERAPTARESKCSFILPNSFFTKCSFANVAKGRITPEVPGGPATRVS